MVKAQLSLENEEDKKQQKIQLMGLILNPYILQNSEEKCGDRFDFLYEKSIEELKAYYHVYMTK